MIKAIRRIKKKKKYMTSNLFKTKMEVWREEKGERKKKEAWSEAAFEGGGGRGREGRKEQSRPRSHPARTAPRWRKMEM